MLRSPEPFGDSPNTVQLGRFPNPNRFGLTYTGAYITLELIQASGRHVLASSGVLRQSWNSTWLSHRHVVLLHVSFGQTPPGFGRIRCIRKTESESDSTTHQPWFWGVAGPTHSASVCAPASPGVGCRPPSHHHRAPPPPLRPPPSGCLCGGGGVPRDLVRPPPPPQTHEPLVPPPWPPPGVSTAPPAARPSRPPPPRRSAPAGAPA